MKWFFWLGTLQGGAVQRDLEMIRYLAEHYDVEPVVGLFERDDGLEFEQFIIPRMLKTDKVLGWSNYFAEHYFSTHLAYKYDAFFCRYATGYSEKFWFYRISGDIRNTKHSSFLGKLFYWPLMRKNVKNLGRADAIVSCSRASDGLVLESGQKNIIRSKNFIDTEVFRPRLFSRSGVLFVGRDDPIKNLGSLRKACNELGVELKTVGLNGWFTPEDLAREYSKAEVVVLPSHYESYGIVALEALACHTPVIVSDKVTALVDLSPFVYVCDTSVNGIKTVLDFVLEHPDDVLDKARSGGEYVRKEFSKDVVLGKECEDIMRCYYER